MTHQMTDRELITELVKTAHITGQEYLEYLECGRSSEAHRIHRRERTKLEHQAVGRLRKMRTKIDKLQAEIADLKRELAAHR